MLHVSHEYLHQTKFASIFAELMSRAVPIIEGVAEPLLPRNVLDSVLQRTARPCRVLYLSTVEPGFDEELWRGRGGTDNKIR